MALSTTIKLTLSSTRTLVLDLGSFREPHVVDYDVTWPTGTAVNQADEVWSDSRSLAVGSENLDFTALPQVTSTGVAVRTVAFAVIKAIIIRNTSASGRLVVGGGSTGAGAADAFAGTGYPFATDASETEIPFGGAWVWTDPTGVAVTNGATDILHIEAVGATQTYEIEIVGEAV